MVAVPGAMAHARPARFIYTTEHFLRAVNTNATVNANSYTTEKGRYHRSSNELQLSSTKTKSLGSSSIPAAWYNALGSCKPLIPRTAQ